jgi:hypothetical protein
MKKLIIVASILSLTACEQMQGVDRGLYNVANSVSQRDTVTGARKLSMAGRQQQIQQGNASVAQLINKLKEDNQPINEQIDSAQWQRLNRIFKRIHAASHFANEQWTVYMIPDDSFNAFTTGGSTVVVHSGLMKALKSDDQVAAVIGHEIAHVSANHVFEGQAGQIAASLAGSNSAKTKAYQAGYSLNNEVEADEIGILYTALAGYDPNAATQIWQSIYQSEGLNGQFYTTHPRTKDRAADNQAIAQKVRQYYIPGQVNPDAQNLLSNNVLYQKRGDFIEAGQGGGLAAILETAGGFYLDHSQAKAQARKQTADIAALQQIQSSLSVVGQENVDANRFALGVKYNGARSVDNLAIRAVGPAGNSLYRAGGTVNPGETFSAVFSKNILSNNAAENKSIKLIVDEGNLR